MRTNTDSKPAMVTEAQKRKLLLVHNFTRVPSVMTGGKRFFFVRFFDCDGKRVKATLAWNRAAQSWQYEHETMGKALSEVEEAQRWVRANSGIYPQT